MKKINFLFFVVITTLVTLSCKKEFREDIPAIANNVYVKSLKSLYESMPLETKFKQVRIKEAFLKVEENPVWAETQYFPENNIVVTPIKIKSIKSDAPIFKYLVAKIDTKGKIEEMNYYRLFAGKDKIKNDLLAINNSITLSKIISEKNLPTDLTVILMKYSDRNSLLSVSTYKDGFLVNKKNEQNDKHTQESFENDDCSEYIIDSWWVTYENGNIVSIEYLYSTTYTVCSSGGGNGGNNTTTCSNLFSDMYSSTTVVNEYRGETIINQTQNTRTALYEWNCLRNNGGWVIYSTEKGVHVNTNNSDPALQWQFQSVTHEGIALVGIVAGGAVEPNVTASNFTVGLYNMHVYLSLSVKYSLVCSGFPLSTTQTYNPHRGFNITQTQQ